MDHVDPFDESAHYSEPLVNELGNTCRRSARALSSSARDARDSAPSSAGRADGSSGLPGTRRTYVSNSATTLPKTHRHCDERISTRRATLACYV